MCKSRRELSNEYLLAKIGVDTAENEPLEVWGKIFTIIHWCPYRDRAVARRAGREARRVGGRHEREGRAAGCAGNLQVAYFCKKMLKFLSKNVLKC